MCQWTYSPRSNKSQGCISGIQCMERAEKFLNPEDFVLSALWQLYVQEPCLKFELTSQDA